MSDSRERAGDSGLDVDAYCRAVETHLCRKNDGHLIRVSGPAFDLVRGWAEQGIPLGVVRAGIDRTFERYYAKGPRRRPVHIAFCEADVLDAFDAWRRALGLPMTMSEDERVASPAAARHPRTESLPAHLERVLHRLTLLRAAATGDRPFDEALGAAVRAIDALRAGARQVRGENRAAALATLARIDDDLLAHARTRLEAGLVADLEKQAEAELATFRERMPPAAFAAARAAACDRLVRAAAGLPVIRYEG